MPAFNAKITVTLRRSILDPQGKAIHHALENLQLAAVKEVRIGKFVELKLEAASESDARNIVEQACKKLLSNPVMEDYAFVIEAQTDRTI
jgi:phosphoribosylformylglycinamidine synthase subunit PurS